MAETVTRQCSACGSKRLARGHVATEGWPRWPLAFYRPGGFLGLGKHTTTLRATACADCGMVQFSALNRDAVNELYEGERRDSLQLAE